MAGTKTKAYYIRYFTFKEGIRSAPKNQRIRKNGILKQEVGNLLEGKLFDEQDPHLYYAYIDPKNLRSLRLAENFGFYKAGSFRTVFYSRFFPSRSGSVFQIGENELPEIFNRLAEYYSDHQLLSFENIGHQGHFYVYREGGEIIAGLQASPEYWEVLDLPGSSGKLLLNVISRVPVINRMFGSKFRFLSVEGLFCKEGRDEVIDLLMQDILARMKLSTVVMCLDPESEPYKITRNLDLGLMSRLSEEHSFDVMVKREGNVPEIGNAPCYVSAFDVM